MSLYERKLVAGTSNNVAALASRTSISSSFRSARTAFVQDTQSGFELNLPFVAGQVIGTPRDRDRRSRRVCLLLPVDVGSFSLVVNDSLPG